jgi:hypothetical protein
MSHHIMSHIIQQYGTYEMNESNTVQLLISRSMKHLYWLYTTLLQSNRIEWHDETTSDNNQSE